MEGIYDRQSGVGMDFMYLLCLLAETSLSGFSLEAKQFDRMSRKEVERIQSICRIQKWRLS